MSDPTTEVPEKTLRPDDTDGEPLRTIASSTLFRNGARRVVIRHNGRDYLLLRTKQGKLLLNLR